MEPKFQSLIGTLKTVRTYPITTNAVAFQSLIGTLKTLRMGTGNVGGNDVSIPNRDAKNDGLSIAYDSMFGGFNP